MAILYVAAEAAELKPFADLLTGLRKLNWPVDYAYEGIRDGRRILLTANGAGPKLAAQAVEVALRAAMAAELSSSKLEAVISTGFCGALDPQLGDGQIVMASSVIHPADAVEYECRALPADPDCAKGRLLSQDAVANDAGQKARLFATGAIAVDMEAAGVAARSKRAGLPFGCIKVVSDRAEESFPFDLNQMRSKEGRIARGKIVRYALTHPGVIPALYGLKQRTEDAAVRLGNYLAGTTIIANSNTVEPQS